MIKPETKQTLEALAQTQYGQALQEYLDEEFELLNDIQTCKSWEETIGRQLALKSLEHLFSFMALRPKLGKGKNQYY